MFREIYNKDFSQALMQSHSTDANYAKLVAESEAASENDVKGIEMATNSRSVLLFVISILVFNNTGANIRKRAQSG